MKLVLILALCFIFAIIDTVSSLKCYECRSVKSRADCEATQILANCSAGHDRCFTFELGFEQGKNNTQVFEKGCEKAAKCDMFAKKEFSDCKIIPPNATLILCDGACCDTEGCNKVWSKASSVIVCSALVLLSSVVLTLI